MGGCLPLSRGVDMCTSYSYMCGLAMRGNADDVRKNAGENTN